MFKPSDFMMRDIDVVFVVNKEFEIVYSSRFDECMGTKTKEIPESKGIKNLFELFPSLNLENSSLAKCIRTGEVVYNNMQKFTDINGKIYVSRNLTFPVFEYGKIIGAVEMTKDLATTNNYATDTPAKPNKTIFLNAQNNSEEISFDKILTNDNKVKRAIESAKIYSQNMNPTLIYGETGTGKELLVQAMIAYSGIPKKKIVIQNCGAVPENLIESILFGTTRGSYTGAENKRGLFEDADGGILFLDELNSLPYTVQSKLLRVVQDGSFRPIGSNTEKKVNVKLIAAMNMDPVEAVDAKILRKDLFYRLSNGMIYLPPLRKRKKDIEFFIEHYIDEFNEMYDKNVEGLSSELKKQFMNYEWDGNVRELKHVMETMVSMSNNTVLSINDIPLYLYNKIEDSLDDICPTENEPEIETASSDTLFSNEILDVVLGEDNYDLNNSLDKIEKDLILRALEKTNGNKTKAGKFLNIPRQTLKYRMDKLGIDNDENLSDSDEEQIN